MIGEEARQRGKHVLLGPGCNIMRTPLCGRNYDYYGEDPWLAGRLAVAYVRGLQAEQVVACIKHFAANNQEADRRSVDVQMDERTLREIYLPASRPRCAKAARSPSWAPTTVPRAVLLRERLPHQPHPQGRMGIHRRA